SESDQASGFECDFKGHFRIVIAAIFKRHDLERPGYGAKIRQYDLPVADFAIEEEAADQRIRRCILEDTRPADRSTLNTAARKQLPPATGRIRIGHIDGFRIEGDTLGAQSGTGFKQVF